MNVLHIVPRSVLDHEQQGAYKDVLSRIRWLDEHAETYRRFAVEEDDPGVASSWSREPVPTHILVEYSRFPRLVAHLRKIHPHARMLVRAHNIEPLQHLDNVGWGSPRGNFWLLYGMGRLFRQDGACARQADVVLSINEWENRVYWNRLAGRSKVEWLPYVCPEERRPANPEPYEARRMIACVPTPKWNRKSRDLVLRFFDLARGLKKLDGAAEFAVTGNLDGWELPSCPEVVRTGHVADLPALLGRCRAVALPSPLGYGFKTTMADALAAGAHVLAHPALVRRSPEIVRPYLIAVDGARETDLRRALDALRRPPRSAEFQSAVSALFERTMRKCFLGDSQ